MDDFITEFRCLVGKHLKAHQTRAKERRKLPKSALPRDCCVGCVNDGEECGAVISDFAEGDRCLKRCPSWPGMLLIYLSMAPLAWMLMADGWMRLRCVLLAAALLALGFLWFCAAPGIYDFVRRARKNTAYTHREKGAEDEPKRVRKGD